ncbi:MAG: hypothetical protein EP340_03470 [Alphaproteobacteria bacterium]|nr:MAG: hypothetical protein EP340_03470 [Alphaproteobacteria bacterium]
MTLAGSLNFRWAVCFLLVLGPAGAASAQSYPSIDMADSVGQSREAFYRTFEGLKGQRIFLTGELDLSGATESAYEKPFGVFKPCDDEMEKVDVGEPGPNGIYSAEQTAILRAAMLAGMEGWRIEAEPSGEPVEEFLGPAEPDILYGTSYPVARPYDEINGACYVTYLVEVGSQKSFTSLPVSVILLNVYE